MEFLRIFLIKISYCVEIIEILFNLRKIDLTVFSWKFIISRSENKGIYYY
jgi:hypothetical protein